MLTIGIESFGFDQRETHEICEGLSNWETHSEVCKLKGFFRNYEDKWWISFEHLDFLMGVIGKMKCFNEVTVWSSRCVWERAKWWWRTRNITQKSTKSHIQRFKEEGSQNFVLYSIKCGCSWIWKDLKGVKIKWAMGNAREVLWWWRKAEWCEASIFKEEVWDNAYERRTNDKGLIL